MVIKFTNNTKLKGRANVLDDRIKFQNNLDKAERWDEIHKMKLTDILWIKKLINEQTPCMCTRWESLGLIAFLLMEGKKKTRSLTWSLVEH